MEARSQKEQHSLSFLPSFCPDPLFSLKPGNITLWIGKVINPLFLFFLAILILSALLHPGTAVSAAQPDPSYETGAMFHALSEGYGTMDAIAGLAFGIVVVNVIRQMGVDDDTAIAKKYFTPVSLQVF